MIKREKVFFHLVTKFTTRWSRQEKVFFSFRLFVHYTMIKREKDFFILLLRSLHYDQHRKSFFFHWITTFTMPWSTKNVFSFQHYICYVMLTRKRNRFSLHHYLDYATIIKKYLFLISLRRSLCKYLLTSHYVTNEKVSKWYPPQKNMC